MRNLKRRSEFQLSRAGSSQCQDPISDYPMATFYDLGSMLWNWCVSFIVPRSHIATSDSVRSMASIVTPEKSKSTPSFSYEVSHKRQRIRKFEHAPLKSKSISDLHSTEVSEKLDVSKCDADEARRKIEKFWEPRPMPWMEQHLIVDQQPSTARSRLDPEAKFESPLLKRRYSDPSKPPSEFERRSRQILSEKELRCRILSFDQHSEDDIEATIENLLIDSTKQLTISDSKKAKNALRAKEIKERERQKAINKARQRRLHRIYPKQRLVQSLDPYWVDRVNKVYTTRGEDVLTTSIGGTELRIKDFRTLLDHRAWLNDEIINTYIEWIVDAANRNSREESFKFGIKSSSTPRFIAHNSFFYENLRRKGPQSLDRLMKRKGAPGLSLLDVDSVFVPICNGAHWTLGVVRPVAKTIEYFDSMGGNPSNFIFYMQCWLKHQLGGVFSLEEWTIPKTACAIQTNGYDCGVFVCTNAFCVAVGLDTFCYQESDMIRQRKNIAAILLNRGFTGDFAWKVRENDLSY